MATYQAMSTSTKVESWDYYFSNGGNTAIDKMYWSKEDTRNVVGFIGRTAGVGGAKHTDTTGERTTERTTETEKSFERWL